MIFLISKSPWRCGDAFPEVSLMVQTKNKAKLGVIRFLLSPSSRPVVTMICPYVPAYCVAPGDTCVKLCAVGDTGLKTGWVSCVLR